MDRQKPIAAPDFPRSRATNTIKSSALSVLAEHMVKYSCMPNHPAHRHWQKEIQTFLSNVMIGVASRTTRDSKSQKRKIVSLHFSAAFIEAELDARAEEAFLAVLADEDYTEQMVNVEPLVDFFEDYWRLDERKAGGGIFWVLSFKGMEVAVAPR